MSVSTRPGKHGLTGTGTHSLLSSKPLTGTLTSSSLLASYGVTSSGSGLLGSTSRATNVDPKDTKLATLKKEMKDLKKAQKVRVKETEKLSGRTVGHSSFLTSNLGQSSSGSHSYSQSLTDTVSFGTSSHRLTGTASFGTRSLGISTKSSLLSGSTSRSSLLTSGIKSSTLTAGTGSNLSPLSGLTTETGRLSSLTSRSTKLTSNLHGPSSLLATGTSTTSGLLQSTQFTSMQTKALRKKVTRQQSKGKKIKDTYEEARRMGYTDFVVPDYHFESDSSDSGIEVASFCPPDQDENILSLDRPVLDITGMKRSLINVVSASLIRAPNFKETHDPVRLDLIAMADNLIYYDAEFVLKLALYTRNELNIRTTANFLLAYAANNAACRPYLKKYYSISVRLPSDWIDVAEQYQAFHDKNLNFGSLPAALRRVMVSKFPDFDKYQLAKYNKESSRKKKQKGPDLKKRGPARSKVATIATQKKRTLFDSDSESDSDEDNMSKETKKLAHMMSEVSETEEELALRTFTLKQLIRKLHIVEPVEHVMCLIGKKYPSSLEEFYKSRLPDTWDEERAGKRMKLPTPETWETQVSLKGNKASTWEQLLDHNKLPFMAMLRNLRNMIKAGISRKHHAQVLRKLTNQYAVVNSRQFPFRFFSAYEVLDNLQKEYERNQQDLVDAAVAATTSGPAVGRGRGRGLGRGRGGRGRGGRGRGGRGRGGRGGETGPPEEVAYDSQIIERYRKALDTAVKFATTYNVAPISGRTIIFCNIGDSMRRPCTSAKGLGKPRELREVAVLLGLMCKYSCEDCRLVVYGSSGYHEVALESGTILVNMERVLQLSSLVGGYEQGYATGERIPPGILNDFLVDQLQIDNLIVLSAPTFGLPPEDGQLPDNLVIKDFLQKYRRLVNPNLLYVNINLAPSGPSGIANVQPDHENDIYIAGYSDQILRFIAERGDSGQVIHVEKIDQKYELKAIPQGSLEKTSIQHKLAPPHPLPVIANKPRWRTARVFISSTFRDMHGERDLLTRFVFPELRARASKHFINVHEVDLRWGVTEEETRSNKTLELCLDEITRCQFFVGILGERYGWVPDKYMVPDSPQFDWVRDYPKGASITELEMHFAALAKPEREREFAFFFIRDNSFMGDVPKQWQADFESKDKGKLEKLQELKEKLQTSGLEVYDSYPCQWGGVVDGKAMVTGLEEFGTRVLNNLWNAILHQYPKEDAILDEFDIEDKQHDAYQEYHQDLFVGRKNLLKQCMNKLADMTRGMLVLAGKAGSGKTSLVAYLVQEYVYSKHCNSGLYVLYHFIGAAPGSTNIVATLRRLCHELKRRFSIQTTIPEEYKDLVSKFGELLEEAGSQSTSPLVVVLEGLDLLDSAHQAQLLDWIPAEIPENVIFLMSMLEGTGCYKAATRRDHELVTVGPLDMWDKSEVVKKTLAVHSKQLDESPFNNQMKLLVSKKEANVPLFLSLACEELRVFGQFEKINDKLKSLPQTVPAMLQDILARLEIDHGKDLVAASLSLLVCARNGLLETELHTLLSYVQVLGKAAYQLKNVRNVQLSADQLLPSATFSALLRGIRGFLRPTPAHRQEQLSLAHADIGSAVYQRYMKSSSADQQMVLHHLLAGFFYRLADPDGNGTWRGQSDRAFSELPYHIACAGCYKELEETLCSLLFIHAKSKLGLAPQLLQDFIGKGQSSKTAEREQEKFCSKEAVKQYQSFVSRNIHIFTNYPALTWQQALNEPENTQPAAEMASLLERDTFNNKGSMMQWINKPQGQDPCQLTISSVSQTVTCVAVSADSQYLACGSLDCTVKLYDLSTGKELKTFMGHSNKITGVCFVNKDRLCSSSTDNSLSLWSVSEGHRIAVMKGHNRQVNACCADPAGKLIVSASWDCMVKAWHADTGKLACEMKDNTRPVNCVGFHPEGTMVVLGSWDATIKIWDTFNNIRKAVLRGHTSSVRDVSYSPSGRHIASASLDGAVKLWSALNGSQVGNISGHALPINKLTFSPTGQQLVTVSNDCKVKVWSGHLGTPVDVLGEENDGPVSSVAFSPNGQRLAASYHSAPVRVYDTTSGLLEFECTTPAGGGNCVRFTKCDSYLVTGSHSGTLHFLKADSGKAVSESNHHTKPVLSIACGESHVVSGSEDCMIHIFSIFDIGKKQIRPVHKLTGHTGAVTSLAFNPDSTKLVSASKDKSISIWDVYGLGGSNQPNIKPESTIDACHLDWITAVSWSNTGDYIVTASNDFNLKLWDVKNMKEKAEFKGHMSAINSVAYSFGCIVSCSFDGQVKVWSHKGTEITTLYGHSQRVNCCDIMVKTKKIKEEVEESSSDWATMVEENEWKKKHDKTKLDKQQVQVQDVLVASCSDDGTIRLWRPIQGNELACLMGHSDRVISVDCNSTGTIFTSSLDRTIKVWKPELEKGQSWMGSHDAPVSALAVSPCGSLVLSGSRDGIVKIWKQGTDEEEDSNKAKVTAPHCVYTFQPHEKCVTCMSFQDPGFITGSEDCTIKIWEVVNTTKGITVKKLKTLSGSNSPITTRVHSSEPYPGDEHIVSTNWNGDLTIWNANDGQVLGECPGNGQWILGSALALQQKKVVTVGIDGCISIYEVSGPEQLTKALTVSVPEVVPDPGQRHTQSAWLHSVALSSTGIHVGDSSGRMTGVHLGAEDAYITKKVHGGPITCCVASNDYLITGSRDQTIKVWQEKEEDYIQVGQFFCQAPVTALLKFPSKEENSCHLVSGDQLGNVNFLKWRA